MGMDGSWSEEPCYGYSGGGTYGYGNYGSYGTYDPAGGGCTDTEGWTNNFNTLCQGYVDQGWCMNGAVAEDMLWTSGQEYNYPELNCCACGGGTGGTTGAGGGCTDTE